MRHSFNLALCILLLPLSGCHKRPYTVPESPLPPNTILLSQMMRQLSAQSGFTDGLIAQLDKNGKKGPALLTPALIDELRKRILGQDWQGLDRFPGWTMREVNPTVRVIGHEAGKSDTLESAAAVHPGAPITTQQAKQYLDLGPYELDKAGNAEPGIFSETSPDFASFTTNGIVTQLGDDIVRGDGPNDLAPEHSESMQLADILNRLAANKLDGAQTFTASLSGNGPTTPEALIQQLINAGATVSVTDSRYFANFGHLHYKGADVMMPFFINSEIVVPHSNERPLLVPVSHAEYEWHIRLMPQICGGLCPTINADVSYYFGIDGKSEWRVMDTLDQAWVLKRDAHTYTGADAVEVTRLAGLLTVAYMHQHLARPTLPFGGYYALGVCQDGVSAIEHKMTGHVTLYPNTVDATLFNDLRDAEVNALMAAIPNDRSGIKPQPERIFGSLPAAPDASGRFTAVNIPGLADDLNATYAAWKDGTLERTHSRWDSFRAWLFILSAAGIALLLALKTRHFFDHKPVQRNRYR